MIVQRMDNQYRWQVPATSEPPSIAAKRVDYVTQSGLSEQDSVRILDTNAPHMLGLDSACAIFRTFALEPGRFRTQSKA